MDIDVKKGLDWVAVIFLSLFLLFTGLFWGSFVSTSCKDNTAQYKEEYNNDKDTRADKNESGSLPQGHSKGADKGRKCSVFFSAISWFAEGKSTDWALIMFTGVLAWKTWGLDSSTRRLWEAATEADRPFMTFSKIHFSNFNGKMYDDGPDGEFTDVILGFSILVEWENTGKRPGLVQVYTEHRLVEFDEKIVPNFVAVFGKDGLDQKLLVGPGKVGFGREKSLGDFDYQALLARKKKVAIYSKALYKSSSKQIIPFFTETSGFIYYNGDVTDRRTGLTTKRYIFEANGSQQTFS